MSVPAYLLVPHARVDAPAGPAVLAVHGHGPGKARVCGIDAGGAGDDYAHALAELGYVVFAPDLRGFGERAEWMPEDHYHCDWDLVCATMAGVVPLERNLWDLMRAIDVLEAHPLVDADRIGAGGLSYGGTCTLFLTALDARVRACVVSGYLSSWRAAHTVPWNMCGSQVFAAIPDELEHVDVAALVAPRPMLVESGTDDLIFPVDPARETVARLRPLYRDAPGGPDALVHDVFEGGHQWHGERVAAFLERWL
jgi:dienelactone hydrolase